MTRKLFIQFLIPIGNVRQGLESINLQ